MMEASEDEEEYTTGLRDWRKLRRQRGLDNGPEDATTTTEVLTEEDDHKDYYNKNGCVGGG